MNDEDDLAELEKDGLRVVASQSVGRGVLREGSPAGAAFLVAAVPLDERALDGLRAHDDEKARLVEMRVFTELSMP